MSRQPSLVAVLALVFPAPLACGLTVNNPDDEYVPVGTTRSRYQAELWALVLLSAGIANITEQPAADYVVMVGAAQAERAQSELSHFARENRDWPPPRNLPVRAEGETGEQPPTVLLMGGLLAFYLITGSFAGDSEWFSQGAVNSRAILEGGEWWRLITALTLHADPVHLLGNICIGGMVIHFLCQMFGSGRGWFMLILAGTVANLTNVLARGPGHISVGFSTAVFAAVGLLCGGQMNQLNLRSVLLPLGAGVALLAMLGSSGQRTDLGAHLWGLVVGLLLGVAWRWLYNKFRLESRWGKQTYLLAVTILVIWLAWIKALAA
ncbi:MAG: rhomboid family intramembrane serine protease [Thermodesulfobacteriota bacterium]